MIGVIDDDGIRVGNIQTTFNDGCGHQHIIFPFHETHHGVFQLGGFHLSVTNTNVHIRAKTTDHSSNLLNVLHAIVHEENLTSSLYFIHHRITNQFLIERVQFRDHRIAVGRWRIDHRKVARTHQTELKRSRNWRCGERERIHIHLHLFEFVLYGNSKLLLLIDDQQTKVLELHILTYNSVRSDENIRLAFRHILECFGLLLARFETVDILNITREFLQP